MQRLGVIGGTGLIDMTLGEQLSAHGLALVQRDAVTVETPYGEVPLTCIELSEGDEKKHKADGTEAKEKKKEEPVVKMTALEDDGDDELMSPGPSRSRGRGPGRGLRGRARR